MKPIYFDLTVENLPATRKFLEDVLNWRFTPFPMPFDYYRIEAGSSGEQGIDGGIGAVPEGTETQAPMVALTMEVPDIDEISKNVIANGGKLIGPKITIPGIGQHQSFAEPGGLIFGLLQPYKERLQD